jgi:hypothetical protein
MAMIINSHSKDKYFWEKINKCLGMQQIIIGNAAIKYRKFSNKI